MMIKAKCVKISDIPGKTKGLRSERPVVEWSRTMLKHFEDSDAEAWKIEAGMDGEFEDKKEAMDHYTALYSMAKRLYPDFKVLKRGMDIYITRNEAQ